MISWKTILICVAALAYASAEDTKVVESFHVTTDIRYRFATTTMTSVVRNTAPEAQEVTFDVVLPKEAFIMHFAMTIDGKTYDGEVKEKQEAKQQYQEAVDRGQSAGHVRQAARHANMFEVSVNVANGTAVNFTLSYQELLRRTRGVYEYELHVQPGQPVEDFMVQVYIQETKSILYVKTPALRSGSLITNEIEEVNQLTIIDRPSAETAVVQYRPSLKDQGEKGIAGRFVVQYDMEHGPTGDLMVVDGYFVHFFSPNLPPMPKDIIFVLDLSGSMSGSKLSQLKQAMKVILGDLQDQDRFNIITFSTDVSKWGPELVQADNPEVIAKAQHFVKKMEADGMTNINKALLTAVKELAASQEDGRASLVFFLTDGQPTSGERKSDKIASNVREANEKDVAVLSLAFGSGADFESLKTISGQNSGFARKIYDASDAALQVANLYNEVSAVIMKDLTVSYLPNSVDEFTVTKNEFPVVFNGTEIVICGFLSQARGPFKAELKGLKAAGEIHLVFETDDVTNFVIDIGEEEGTNLVLGGGEDEDGEEFSSPRDLSGLVERMWAYVTIKQLLKEKEKEANNKTRSEELKEQIIELSLKYRLVTPLTSMVVTKPDSEEKDQASFKDAHDREMAYDSRGTYMNSQHSFAMSSSVHGRRRSQMPKVGMAGLPGLSGGFGGGFGGSYHDPHQVYYHPMPTIRPATRRPLPTMRPRPTMMSRPTTTTTTLRPTTIQPTRTTLPPPTARPTAKTSKNAILTALTLVTLNDSVCLAPKKLRPGIYTLFKQGADEFKIETYCVARNCRFTGLKSLNVTSPNGTMAVFPARYWNMWHKGDAGLNMTSDQRSLALGGPGKDFKITIRRHITKKYDRYAVTMDLTQSRPIPSGTNKLEGIMDMAFSRQSRKKSRKPRGCNGLASRSTFLTRRALNRLKLMPYVHILN